MVICAIECQTSRQLQPYTLRGWLFTRSANYVQPLQKSTVEDFFGAPRIEPVFLRNERNRWDVDPILFGQEGAFFEQFVRKLLQVRKRPGENGAAVADRHVLGSTAVCKNSKPRKPLILCQFLRADSFFLEERQRGYQRYLQW